MPPSPNRTQSVQSQARIETADRSRRPAPQTQEFQGLPASGTPPRAAYRARIEPLIENPANRDHQPEAELDLAATIRKFRIVQSENNLKVMLAEREMA